VFNYIIFSYSLFPFFFIVLGISYLFYKRRENDKLLLSWAFILLIFVILYNPGAKVESLSRWLLPVMPMFAIFAGCFTDRILEFFKGYGKYFGMAIGFIFIIMIMIYGFSQSYEKAESLRPAKIWSPAFVSGCEWIRWNTPKDSQIVSIWINHGMYHCKRDVYWNNLPNRKTIVEYSNDTSYELLKKTGMDYIYFQKFSISFSDTPETYPVKFVRYVMFSDKFEKVYDFPPDCINHGDIRDCVAVYKIR